MRIAFTLGAVKKVGLALLVCCGALAGSLPAAADEPRVPEEVADYFSSALIPRLVDLYGQGGDGQAGIDFDDSTTVGTITRVLAWTEDFRAGRATDKPVELTNNWVASITVSGEEPAEAEGETAEENVVEQVGVATVWISPYTNLPELANFVPSAELGPALAAAPEGSLLIHDEERDSWFALVDDQLTALSPGSAGTPGGTVSLDEARDTLWRELPTLPAPQSNSGFVIAGLTLGFVVVLLAIFVLIPDRKRSVLDPEVALGFAPREQQGPDRQP